MRGNGLSQQLLVRWTRPKISYCGGEEKAISSGEYVNGIAEPMRESRPQGNEQWGGSQAGVERGKGVPRFTGLVCDVVCNDDNDSSGGKAERVSGKGKERVAKDGREHFWLCSGRGRGVGD